MITRRNVICTLSQVPVLGAALSARASPPRFSAPLSALDVWERLKPATYINAGEPFTVFGGAPVRAEVREAMRLAATKHVRISEAQRVVGARLAELLDCQAAMVTSGAAGGLTVGTAACITGPDRAKIALLPNTAELRHEVIIQKAHRYSYEQAVRATGAKMIEVETSDQLIAAIGPATAILLFNNRWNEQGAIKHEEFVRIGKAHAIPTFIDCASDAPPAANLRKFNRLGFDLVTFSGGKGLRAPSSTGVLMGRADLIDAALRNSAPNDECIGRALKVGTDEIAGFLVAVELCLQEANESAFSASETALRRMALEFSKIVGVRTEIFNPPVSYNWPHLRLQWDEAQRGITAEQVRRKLNANDPPIVTRTGPDKVVGLELSAWMLSGEDAHVVVQQVIKALGG